MHYALSWPQSLGPAPALYHALDSVKLCEAGAYLTQVPLVGLILGCLAQCPTFTLGSAPCPKPTPHPSPHRTLRPWRGDATSRGTSGAPAGGQGTPGAAGQELQAAATHPAGGTSHEPGRTHILLRPWHSACKVSAPSALCCPNRVLPNPARDRSLLPRLPESHTNWDGSP